MQGYIILRRIAAFSLARPTNARTLQLRRRVKTKSGIGFNSVFAIIKQGPYPFVLSIAVFPAVTFAPPLRP